MIPAALEVAAEAVVAAVAVALGTQKEGAMVKAEAGARVTVEAGAEGWIFWDYSCFYDLFWGIVFWGHCVFDVSASHLKENRLAAQDLVQDLYLLGPVLRQKNDQGKVFCSLLCFISIISG